MVSPNRQIANYASEHVSVKDFGAVGDGVTDDGPAINTALLEGGDIFIPAGTYLCSTTIDMPHNYIGTIHGDRGASVLKTDSVDLFTITSGFSGVIRDLKLESTVTGGHIFNMSDTKDAGSGWYGMANARLSNLFINILNPVKSVINMVQIISDDTANYIDVLFDNFTIFLTVDHSVPAFNFNTVFGGAVGANKWSRGRITYGAVHPFVFISSNASSYLFDNILDDINFELTYGGGVYAEGVNNLTLRNMYLYDVNNVAGGESIDDFIHIGKHASGISSKFTTITNCQRRSSGLQAGKYDINLAAGGAVGTIITNCQNSSASDYRLNLGSNVETMVFGTRPTNVIDGIPDSSFIPTRNDVSGDATILLGQVKVMGASLVPTSVSHVDAGGGFVVKGENTDGNGSSLWVRETGYAYLPVQTAIARTSTQLLDAADSINTIGKVAGKQVWNSTTSKPVYAGWGSPTAPWYDATGTIDHTPS